MIIKLDDKFALVTDDYNFVLNGIRIKGEDSVNAGKSIFHLLDTMVL